MSHHLGFPQNSVEKDFAEKFAEEFPETFAGICLKFRQAKIETQPIRSAEPREQIMPWKLQKRWTSDNQRRYATWTQGREGVFARSQGRGASRLCEMNMLCGTERKKARYLAITLGIYIPWSWKLLPERTLHGNNGITYSFIVDTPSIFR